VETAVQETLNLKRQKQTLEEWASLCTKLWQEVVTKERDSMEVLIEIKEKDAASFPFRKTIIEDNRRLTDTLDNIKRYINSATKGEYSDEELIRRYFSPEGPLSMLYTYADYLEEKMPIAEKLGLT
jgi:hypothetical protein